MKDIQIVKAASGFYLTIIDNELKEILCIKDYQGIFYNGRTYHYKLSKHNETGIEVYIVTNLTNNSSENHYFTKKSLSYHFDTISIIRDEKLKKLGI
jgi:hypothetical protein